MDQLLEQVMVEIGNRKKFEVLNDEHLKVLSKLKTLESLDELKSAIGLMAEEYVRLNQELKEQVEFITVISETDPLTQVANRQKIQAIMATEWERAKRYHSPTSTIMFDVDGFMAINETHGQELGDQIIRELAGVVKKNIRLTDTIGRLGGDEFMIIVPTTNNVQAAWLGNKLKKAVADHTFMDNIHVTCSFGVADSEASMDPEDWMKIVNDAMQYAKDNGKNQVVDYEDINKRV